MAAGILIAGLSGLCSLVILFGGALGGGSGGDFIAIAPLVLLIGGIPFAIGLGLFFWGRALGRSYAREQAAQATDFE